MASVVRVLSFSLDAFDLDAAILRKSEADLRGFLGVLADKLEEALPGRVTVRRRRDGLLSGKTHVAEVTLRTDGALYAIALDHGAVKATRARIVRDVVIATAALPARDWLAAVRTEVAALADAASDAGDMLARFL